MTPEGIDWTLTTYEGNRRRQHQEFRARPFGEKLDLLEQMGDVAEYFRSRRAAEASAKQRGAENAEAPGRETKDA